MHDDRMMEILVNAVVPHTVALCCNKDGNHVVQLLLSVSSKETLVPLYEQLLNFSYDVRL